MKVLLYLHKDIYVFQLNDCFLLIILSCYRCKKRFASSAKRQKSNSFEGFWKSLIMQSKSKRQVGQGLSLAEHYNKINRGSELNNNNNNNIFVYTLVYINFYNNTLKLLKYKWRPPVITIRTS